MLAVQYTGDLSRVEPTSRPGSAPLTSDLCRLSSIDNGWMNIYSVCRENEMVLICEKSHSSRQFHSLNPKSLLTTACSQRYMWRGGNTQMDGGEREIER